MSLITYDEIKELTKMAFGLSDLELTSFSKSPSYTFNSSFTFSFLVLNETHKVHETFNK